MAVSSSSNITPAELPEGENEWSGQAVLEIANGGSIYIKPGQQSPEPFCQPTTTASSLSLEPSSTSLPSTETHSPPSST